MRVKSERITKLVHEIENAIYYGMNLKISLMEETDAVLEQLEAVFTRVEEKRPGKDTHAHL